MAANRLFHVSDNPNIKVFEPRQSPSYHKSINGNVVYAIADTLLHNYLLPRDCPRICFCSTNSTLELDKEKFFDNIQADFVLAIENKWYEKIQETTLYCYEFPLDDFILLDEEAGYYVSYKNVTPIAMQPVNNLVKELQSGNVELLIKDTLWALAKEISQSTLRYSLIRMRNAIPDVNII